MVRRARDVVGAVIVATIAGAAVVAGRKVSPSVSRSAPALYGFQARCSHRITAHLYGART